MYSQSTPTPDYPDEADLVTRAVDDPDAFAVLYNRYVDQVYRYVRARVSNEADAQDITAQAFMAALSAIKRYDPNRASLSTWLIGIARHKMMDFFRRRTNVSLEQVAEAKQPGPSVHDLVRQRLDLDAVRQALAQLPAERAEVIQLRLISGLSTAETAKAMGRTPGSVKMLLLRALRDLRGLLGVDLTEEKTS